MDWGPVDGHEPSASEACAPAWDACAWSRRIHKGQDQSVVLREETHTSGAVVSKVELAEVHVFFESIIVWSW